MQKISIGVESQVFHGQSLSANPLLKGKEGLGRLVMVQDQVVVIRESEANRRPLSDFSENIE